MIIDQPYVQPWKYVSTFTFLFSANMPAPQAVSNGYVSSQTGGILRFSHGKMTSSYHVRHRQDRDRNQKESYLTGSIKNPLNRYSRQIGLGLEQNRWSLWTSISLDQAHGHRVKSARLISWASSSMLNTEDPR